MPKTTQRGAPQLFDTSGMGPATHTEWPDVNKEMTPLGTVGHPESGRWKERPQNHPMAMFHSAREIMAGWAPAEGDRMYHGTNTLANVGAPVRTKQDPRAGQPTERSMTTDMRSNERWKDPATGIAFFKRTHERIRPPVETDTQMWERKTAESMEQPQQRAQRNLDVHVESGLVDRTAVMMGHVRVKRHPERTQSLMEHLRSTGGSEMKPIPLAHYKLPGGDKPLIAGGQHRVGAWNQINPDQLLPVQHYHSIIDARQDPGYA